MIDSAQETATANEAIEQLSFVAGYLYRLVRFEARDLGIRWTALMVLKDLALLGPSTQRTLADIEQVREPTMTVLLQQMQKKGWVTRRRDPRSARVKLATITPKGAQELASAGRFLRQRLSAELDGLSPTQFEGIASGLRPLVELLMAKIGEAKQELAR